MPIVLTDLNICSCVMSFEDYSFFLHCILLYTRLTCVIITELCIIRLVFFFYSVTNKLVFEKGFFLL